LERRIKSEKKATEIIPKRDAEQERIGREGHRQVERWLDQNGFIPSRTDSILPQCPPKAQSGEKRKQRLERVRREIFF